MKYLITTVLVGFVILGVVLPISSAYAAVHLIDSTTMSSACLDSGDCSVCDMLHVFHNVGRFIFASVAAVAMLMFLWGASILIFSFGSMEKVAEGKKTILHTLLAILIILVAWALVNVLILAMAGKSEYGTNQSLPTEMFNNGQWWTGPTCN